MNNSTIIEYSLTNFQFLSVCHYITGFSYFLYDKQLIKLNEQNQTITVLNTLFEYLNNSENEFEVKLKILQKILKETDLYGGGENETLDIKYVDETYHYIISKTLFSHYGNINRYLAGIINKSNKIEYFELKKTVFEEFSQNYKTRDYCSSENESFKLTPLATRKIFDDFIWIIFPLPSENMKIIDVHYIYAMVGLKFISATLEDTGNLTFDNYILIGREIDSQPIDKKNNELIFELFTVPALFFYAYNEREEFRKYNKSLNNEFWINAYKTLFLYINNSMKRIIDMVMKENLHYQLDTEIEKLKTRTFIGYKILKRYCDYNHYGEVPLIYVIMYKTLYLWLMKLILPVRCNDIPNLEDEFNKQFVNVEKTYNEIEMNSIEKVLTDSNLVEKLNEYVTIWFARVPDYPMYSIYVPPATREMNKDIYLLFTIENNNKEEFYALQQKENALTLITSIENEQEFAKAVANDSSLIMEKAIFSIILKYRGENYKAFIYRIAKIKTKQFLKGLKNYYREETAGENVLNVIKSLIPFYNCIESIKANDNFGIGFSCTLDIFSLIPFSGFTMKYLSIFKNELTTKILHTILMNSIVSKVKITGRFTFQTLAKEILIVTSKTITNNILTKEMIKDLLITSLLTVDPGFENLYKLGKFTINTIRDTYKFLHSTVKNKRMKNLISLFETILNKKFLPDHTGLVPFVLGEGNNFQIVRYIYPSGSHFFGPTCLKSFGKTAELRTVNDYLFKLPVVPVKSKDKIFYHLYNPSTGEIFKNKYKMNENNIFEKIGYLLEEFGSQWNEKVIKNYDIYPITVNWNKSPKKFNSQIINSGTRQDYHNSNEHSTIRRKNSDEYVNLQPPEILKRNNLDDNYMNIEYLKTPKENSIIPKSSMDIRDENLVQPGIFKKITVDSKIPPVLNPNIPSTSRGIVKESPYFPPSTVTNKFPSTQIMYKSISFNNPQTLQEIAERQFVNQNLITKEIVPINFPKITNKIQSISKFNFPQSINIHNQGMLIRQTTTGGQNLRENYLYDPNVHKTLLKKNDYINELGKQEYDKFTSQLIQFGNGDLSLLKNDYKNYRNFLLKLDRITFMQIDEILTKPINLWYTQTVKRQNIIVLLKSLKGKDFHFNDITLLTKVGINPRIGKQNILTSDTTIIYQLNINNHYGLIDLTNFHDIFQHQFIIYPEILFIVTDIKPCMVLKNCLIIQLEKKPLIKETWIKKRNNELKLFASNVNLIKSERILNIEAAAEFVSANVPLCEITETKNIMKQYILKIEKSKSQVPTYDKMAQDIYDNLKIPKIYENFKIKNEIFINDVIFEKNLQQIDSPLFAYQRLKKILGSNLGENVQQVFDIYKKSSIIRDSLIFEDFYIIHSRLRKTLIQNLDNERRFLASINRLALRQCNEEWIKNSITIYHSEMLSIDRCNELRIYKEKDNYSFPEIGTFSFINEWKMNRIQVNMKNKYSKQPALFQVFLRNQAGIPNVGRVLQIPDGMYIIPGKMNFIIDNVKDEIINGIKVLVVKLHDLEIPTEQRMIDITKELNNLFSSSTKFYITD
ncbi:uncharacterized protein LOC127290060 isoform X1 [Leptopilina boulardi]|uniref:uncharacterized protein LOC127290060 isoform X1 n=1 Tax=Leptopilina boulardi TaxID=63433 RepID=UPI0021F5AF6A|nr:uncharacterized protein LOC127290060 isoform X1 [Leptopilina boulardi]